MEIKVLDSIMHGVLKPWKMDTTNTRRFTELVKAAKAASPKTIAELQSQMTALLADYPQLKKVLADTTITNDPIQPLSYKTALPKYTDPITNFYFSVITAETLWVYNSILLKAASLTDLVDIQYQINKVLNSIKVLAKQTAAELIERDFTTEPNEQSNHVHYALHCLKHSLIQLYFSVQHLFEDSLQHTTSLEDFYVLDLELPLSAIQQIEYLGEVYHNSEHNISIPQLEQLKLENSEIEQIEIALRVLIIKMYTIDSFTKLKQIVPPHIHEKIKTNVEKEQKKNPALVMPQKNSPEYLLQFSDLQELQAILVAKSNWEIVQDIFGTKENLAIEFNNLAGLRNPIRHSRTVDEVSLLKGRAAIRWFKQQLKMQ